MWTARPVPQSLNEYPVRWDQAGLPASTEYHRRETASSTAALCEAFAGVVHTGRIHSASMRVLTSEQMRAADCSTVESSGVSSSLLMENAGREVVAAMAQHLPMLEEQRVAVVCGKGNNGGDGFVVARALGSLGVDVRVYLTIPRSEITGDAAATLAALGTAGLPVDDAATGELWALVLPAIAGSDLIVDALFGTGLSRPLEGRWAAVIDDLNATGVPIVSVDVPSGVSGETGCLIGATVKATMTVTFGAPKVPLVMAPAAFMAGELVVVDIGIPDAIIDEVPGEHLEAITSERASAWVETRREDVHKGECGRVVIVAGSVGKAGAAQLAALGALRSGAGLVTVATPRSCLGVVGGFMPEYMTLGLDDTTDGVVAQTAADAVLAQHCDVLAVGPGLGLGSSVRTFVRDLVERATVPLILDADALNAFGGELDGLAGRDGREVIITPHPGEMARLTGTTTDQVQTRRLETARELATARCLYVVLKGARTLVVSPDGHALVNLTGNPGMATGGTGDVLTGVVAAWLAQMGITESACGLGVYLHGAAGDRAAELCGEVAMIASDLADCLGPVLLDLGRSVEEDGDIRD